MAFLSRQWFLLTVLVGMLLVWLWPAAVHWTVHLNPTVAGSLAVFLSAWGLETRRLLGALARPWPSLWAILISYLVLPALSWLGFILFANADFRIGLILITSVPCTLASAVIWTRMAGGNEAVSLLVTTLSNCMSWLVTTGWLLLATNVRDVSLGYTASLMGRLVVVLLLPVAVGQCARAIPFLAGLATRWKTVLGVAGRLLILGIMIKAAVEVRNKLDDGAVEISTGEIALVAATCVLLHLSALCLGFWSAGWLGFDRPTRIAVAFAGSQKTLPVSLILFEEYFTAFPLAVLPIACFHVGQLVVDTYLAQRWVGARSADS